MNKIYSVALVCLIGINATKAVTTDAVTLVSAKVPSSKTSLSRTEAEAFADTLRNISKQAYSSQYGQAWDDHLIQKDSLRMPFSSRTIGERPADGYPIFVSLHDIAGSTATANDEQYQKQQHRYDQSLPASCIYITPRAPQNANDTWQKPELDSMLHTMVNLAVMNQGGNPNRVYLIGSCTGGDGVWHIATRQPDHWAAIATTDGHLEHLNTGNLRNTPVMVLTVEGEGNNTLHIETAKLCREMDKLQENDVDGYKHQCSSTGNKGKQLEEEERKSLDWLQQFTRNTTPPKVVWQQGENVTHSHYWLSVPATVTPQPGDKVTAEIDENIIRVSKCNYPELNIWLNDKMVDLDSPVTVIFDGKPVYKGKLPRKNSVIEESVFNRNDFGFYYCSKITLLIQVVK
ncbi:MAG: hypothetical protein IKP81_06860 [Paludibacteraceae bacterium]|nr:hypothetical protein [Paludibacteraceae bacterium]